jgi:hypothetical protein
MSALRFALLPAIGIAIALPDAAFASQLACEGVFGADTSEARFIETFGAENVVTGKLVEGPEGDTVIATTVYPGDPAREFRAVWWDDAARKDLSYVGLPPGETAPGGVEVGMSIEEVETLNGETFVIHGFGWDYGGSALFYSGRLSSLPGACDLSVFFEPTARLPEGVDDGLISGDREVPSDLPLLRQVEPRIWSIEFGYPHPAAADDRG